LWAVIIIGPLVWMNIYDIVTLNDKRLTFGDAQQMKLDMDPFPMDMINFKEKKVLV
jgi:hypothetical protein